MRAKAVLGSFSIRSYRYQWSADILSTWGYEMETLILGWYVLVQTDSPFLVALLGAARFSGTLISPIVGVYADRITRRSILVSMRFGFAALAFVLWVADYFDALNATVVIVVAAVAGLIRPSEMIIRNSLIADTVVPTLIPNALGFSRITMDSARVFGAFAGASLFVSIGIGNAFAAIVAMYAMCIVLTFRIARHPPLVSTTSSSGAFRDLFAGLSYIRKDRDILALMLLALLANVTAFPLTHGLLPVIARDVYQTDEFGLALLTAAAAGGAMLGSLIIAVASKSGNAQRATIIGLIAWHVFIAVFMLVKPNWIGMTLLVCVGLASTWAMLSMSVALLTNIRADMRGRIMGVRMLAVYGLPVGLLVAGALIERFAVMPTLVGFAGFGLIMTLLICFWWLNPRSST